MNTRRFSVRPALVAAAGAALLLAPLSVAAPSSAATDDPAYRATSAPNVFYPVAGGKGVLDQKNFSTRKSTTDITAPCGTSVRAAHPGTAKIVKRTVKGRSAFVVRVHTGSSDELWTSYGYLGSTSVKDGQALQSGQTLGSVTRNLTTRTCALAFAVHRDGSTVNPSSWLSRYVGAAPPVARLYATTGIDLVSFNLLGANHTFSSKVYATYPSRMKRAMALLDGRGIDVAGLQEYQWRQADWFDENGYGDTWGQVYYDPPGRGRDTDNAIIYRKDTMELVESRTFAIPYFYGKPRQMPAALLREKATGRTAWFLNVHNPASSKQRGDHAIWRAQAVAIERQLVIDLRAQGRPVFLTGDFNDSEKAFCPLTAGKLMISPNSQPSDTCAFPRRGWSIDWIFAAGQVRFSSFVRDMTPKQAKINDHPIIQTTAHLQD